jgi:hypothetical protein
MALLILKFSPVFCNFVSHISKYFPQHPVLKHRTIIALMMEAVSTSETSVNFYQTKRRNILEDSHLQFVAVRT